MAGPDAASAAGLPKSYCGPDRVLAAPVLTSISVTDWPASLATHSKSPAASSADGSAKPVLRPDRIDTSAPLRALISVIESLAWSAIQT